MDKSGLSISVKDGRNVLKFNGRAVDSTHDDYSDKFGVRVDGSSFKIDGAQLAQSDEWKPELKSTDSGLSFGGINIGQEVCINITLADYNKLLKGEQVSGYAKLGHYRVYNIVSDVSSSPKIAYADDGNILTFSTGVSAKKMQDMLYNNVSGGLAENAEDLDDTVMGDCPFVNMRYFDPIINIGDGLVLEYFVDNKDMSSMNDFTIGDTFTTIIKLANGTEYKKTTYAGFQYIELPAFNTAGETWFSVRCIGNHGVSSVEQFFDVIVRSSVTENHYEMTAADLETFGIVPDNNDPQVAFGNKGALSSFFASVKGRGYNGVKMLNRTYWVDYHATFGTQRYWRATVSNNRIEGFEEITEQDVILSGHDTFLHNKIPAVNDKFGYAAAVYFIANGVYYQCSVYDGEISTVNVIEQSKIPSGVTPISRTSAPVTGEQYTIESTGTYILVYNTSTSGSQIVFPDEFTVDLNGSTIRVTQCTDLHSGGVITLNSNYDTHIKNGYIVGNYNGFDFATTKRRCGRIFPAEGLGLTGITNFCRYCSFENLDISYSTGYEFGSGGNYGGFDYLDMDKGDEGRRVDLSSGELVDETGCIVSGWLDLKNATTVAIGRSGQGSYQGGTRREIFLSFYDSNKTYISTIKTKLYYISKIPTGAAYMRMTGYGDKAQWPMMGGSGVLGVNRNPGYPTNIKVKNCSWRNTRTCAFTIAGCNGFRVEDCFWTDIALESGAYQVTKILGDFEDGWQRTRNVYVYGCNAIAGNGMNRISMTYCNKLEMDSCTGFAVSSSGIEDGLFIDNTFPSLSIGRNYRSMNPHVVYLRNNIGTLNISYEDGSGNTYNTGHVDKTVPMIDSVITNPCAYKDLVMRNGKNGAILID